MPSSLARSVLVVLTIVGLSGCKSGSGGGLPRWSNPFAKSSANKAPERPTASATPTAPKAGYAAAGADTRGTPYADASAAASGYGTPASYQGQASSHPSSARTGPAIGYGTPGSTASTSNPYVAPQASRYDTGGGYGSPAGGRSYNDPPPYTASRSSASPSRDGSGAREYSTADANGRYGSSAQTAPRSGSSLDRSNRYGGGSTESYGGASRQSAAGYGDSRYGSPLGSRNATGSSSARDLKSSGTRTSEPYASAAGSRYGTAGSVRPWDRTDKPTADPSRATDSRDSFTPGATGYNPGNTGYAPGRESDFRPGQTGYNPPNTPKYQSPASPYSSPYATPAADTGARASGYSPGSTTRYPLRKTAASEESGASADGAQSSYPATNADVTPADFARP